MTIFTDAQGRPISRDEFDSQLQARFGRDFAAALVHTDTPTRGGPSGQTVKGAVCCGLILKNCTIRLD